MARVELKALYNKKELPLSNPCVYLSHLILVDKQEENSIQTQPQPPPILSQHHLPLLHKSRGSSRHLLHNIRL